VIIDVEDPIGEAACAKSLLRVKIVSTGAA
jgi:hypothetical protein